MKQLIFTSFCIASLTALFVGCKKEKLTQNNLNDTTDNTDILTNKNLVSQVNFQNETIYFEYYFDNQLVSAPNYDLGTDGYLNIVEGQIDTNTHIKYITIYTFSDTVYYNAFLNGNNLDFSNVDGFEEDMNNFYQNNPQIIANCENGNCDEYLAYQDSMYEVHFGSQGNIPQGGANQGIIVNTKAPTVIYDNYYGGSPSWIMTVPTVPFMAPGWNDRVSAINNLNIYSFVHLYDKAFFGKRMASFVGFHGWSIIPFIGGLSSLNNKTSSAIH